MNNLQEKFNLIRILSSKEASGLLAKKNLGHLGCSVGDEPYVVPVTYALEGDFIYSHSPEGKKIEIMRKNPNVCLQVEEAEGLFQWRSVIARGRFEELKGDPAAAGMRVLLNRLRLEPKHISSLEMDFEAMLERSIIYRIKIERLTGRAAGGVN